MKASEIINKLQEIIELCDDNICIGYYGNKRIYIKDVGNYYEVSYK